LKRAIGIILLISASGCSSSNVASFCPKIISNDDEIFADHYVALVSEGKFDEAKSILVDRLQVEFYLRKEGLQELSRKLKGLRKELIGCNVTKSDTQRSVNLSYQWSSESSWYVSNVAWVEAAGKKTVFGMNITPIPGPLEKLNAFTLNGKGLRYWAFLFVAVIVLLLILLALVVCWKSKMPQRKWLWMLFIITGLWQFNLNWTTGEIFGFINKGPNGVQYRPISFLPFGSSFSRATDKDAWILSSSLPLGALVFLLRHKRSRVKASLNS
jgi:hypothetical protein